MDGKGREGVRDRKKNKTIKKILPFFTRNSGPVAGNDDGGETGKREAKKRRRKQKSQEFCQTSLPFFSMWGRGKGAAYVSGPGEGDIMVATLLSLCFAVVGGRVTVWCQDLWTLGDFGRFQ